ncbi:MAG TPA: bacteriorhodopsin [Micromonosporaceae bacterium]
MALAVESAAVEWSLWSYVLIMVVGIGWFASWSRDPKDLGRAPYYVAIAILLWSTLCHVVLALGGGRTVVDGHLVDWARYADWAVTAPLLVIALSMTATHALADKRPGTVVVAVLLAVSMIGLGLAADLVTDPLGRYLVYGLGMLALIALFAVIWGPWRAAAARQPEPMPRLYRNVAWSLSALWVAFPLVWVLGPAGLELFGEAANTILFLVLGVLMKVVWSLVDLGQLRSFGPPRVR